QPEQRKGRPALSFETPTGKRWRFVDGEAPAYDSPPNYQRCWYKLPEAVEMARKNRQPLVICNGERSVIVAQHYQIAACAVTGGEKGILPDALLDELRTLCPAGKPIVVAFDCLDNGGKQGPVLAAMLSRSGYTARAVDLGLMKGGDLADFCMLFTDQAS